MEKTTAAKFLFNHVKRGIPFSIVLSYCVLAMQPDLRLAQPFIAGLTGMVTMLLAVALYAGEKGAVSWTPRTILATAALLRVLFLFRQPELSDDIYRYLWDGLQTLSGHNPYSLAPVNTALLSESLAALFGKLNHPTFTTIYPPAAQYIFAAGACPGWGVLGLKALLTVLDLCTCWLLIRLLATMNLAPWRAVLYAWHPLSVLEVAASGHIDGAGTFFLAASLLAVTASESPKDTSITQRGIAGRHCSPGAIATLAAGSLFAAAALVKLTPLFFLPGFLLLLPGGRKALFCSGAVAGGIVLSIFFLPDLFNELDTLAVFARRWEFSGFIYRSLRNASFSGPSARNIVYILFLLLAAGFYAALRAGRSRLQCRDTGEVPPAVPGNASMRGGPAAPGHGAMSSPSREKTPRAGDEATAGALQDWQGATAQRTGEEVAAQDIPVFLDKQVRCKHCPKNRKPPGAPAGFPRQLLFLLMGTFYRVSMAFLMLTPTLYPWYALPFAALLPFAAGPAGLVLSWSVFLSYQVLIPYTLFGVWAEAPYIAPLIWLAPACAFLLSVIFRGRAMREGDLPDFENSPGSNPGAPMSTPAGRSSGND